MTYGQVLWPILGICALHLTHPKCTHTPWTHTHREHTPGAVGSHLCCGARGAVGGSVPCSRAPQSWYWRWRERCTFTPPTYNSCWTETRTHNLLDYESDSLTIRPQLPQRGFKLNVLLVCFIWFLKVLLSWMWTSIDVDMCLDDTSIWIYNWSTWMPCCLILVIFLWLILNLQKTIYFYNYSLKNVP